MAAVTAGGTSAVHVLLRHPSSSAFLVAVLLFLPTLSFPFLEWDDNIYVLRSARIHDTSLAGLANLWSPELALSGGFVEFFPLRDTLYWLVHAVAGSSSMAFHFANVIAHGAASAVVGWFALRLGLEARVALVAGLVFAVHPAHVESVAWISGLKDPLFAAFSLLSLGWLLDAANDQRDQGEPKRWRWLWSVLALVAALLCKSLALAVPVVGAVMLLARGRPLWLVAPHVVVAGLFLLVFLAVGEANGVVRQPLDGSRLTSTLTGAWCLARYLQLALVPTGWSPYHAIVPYVGAFDDPRAWAGLVVVVVVVSAGIVCVVRRRWRAALVLALFAAPLLPVLHVIALPIDLADRFLYLPVAAVALGAGVLAARATRRLALPLLVVAVLAATTLVVQRPWSSDVALWSAAVEEDGAAASSMPWRGLGAALEKAGDVAGADRAFRTGLERQQTLRRMGPELDRRVAEFALSQGDVARAEHHARIAAVADDPEMWGMLSFLARKRGDPAAAVFAAIRARAYAPAGDQKVLVRMAEAYGRALLDAGDLVGARRELERAVAIDPDRCARLAGPLALTGSDACRP